MAANRNTLSALSRGLTGKEEWQDFVAWDGDDLIDPLFQGDISLADTSDFHGSFGSNYHVAESVASDQGYIPSAPTSIVDGPSSFDYTISAPPSVIDGPSSGKGFSWLSTSPSYSTTATSPLAGKNNNVPEGFRAASIRDDVESPLIGATTESPLLDTGDQGFSGSFHSANSFSTASPNLFNPFIAGSPYAFNSLDLNASQAFANVGGWMEQPQIVEPIPELDGSQPIPIPQPASFENNVDAPLLARSAEILREQNRPRAITIPQPARRPASYNAPPPQWAQQVPPLLSVSPEARRRTRSITMSRSNSRTESRRSRNSLTTPSPTSNTFGWVSYQPNHQTNRLMVSGSDGSRGRRQRGRTKALTAEQRKDAALMRVIGACSNCKKRKEKCDPGTPCKSCLDHYKGDLIYNPCRDRLLSDLSKAFLSDRLGWHPTARSLESFIPPNSCNILTGISYTIPLNLGFGPALHVPVHAIQVEDTSSLYHRHIIYSWPPSESKGDTHTHVVLPAVLTPDALSRLPDILDSHLSLLVTHHFRSFPLYCSPLRILREVYVFYRSLPQHTSSSHLLHQALKLLVLVHIGGDVTLPSPSTDPVLTQLLRASMPLDVTSDNITPTPCFIRSQLGSAMPKLALSIMKHVLSSLEQLFLNRECSEWPITLAVLIVVLMTIESIHYHAAKLPYHDAYDSQSAPPDPASIAQDRRVDEQGIESLFKFYAACFSGCHARLKPSWQGDASGETSAMGDRPEDKFIENVREAAKKADSSGYLLKRATEDRQGEDMGFFFDRLVARLLVLDA